MELTLQDVAHERFQEAFNLLVDLDNLSFEESFDLANSVSPVDSAVKVFKKMKHELILKYGAPITENRKDKETGIEAPVVVGWNVELATPENQEAFNKAYEPLLAQTFEIPLKSKIKIQKPMKPIHAFLLQKFIEKA